MLQNPAPQNNNPHSGNNSPAKSSAKSDGKRPSLLKKVFISASKTVAQLGLMAIVIAIALVITQRLVSTRPEVPKRPIFPTVYTVDLLKAKRANHQPSLKAYGEVKAARTVDLRSLVSGEVIAVNAMLKSGGSVKKGDVLLEIDPFNFEGALREAKANQAEAMARTTEAKTRIQLENSRLKSLQEQLQFAQNDLTRISKLRKAGSATQKQLEDRRLVFSQRQQSVQQSELNIVAEKAKLTQQNANIERLNWRLEQAERNLQNTKLIAPFDATIRSSTAEIGKLVNANDVAVSMYQADGLEARFILSDQRFSRIQSDKTGIIGRPIQAIWSAGGIDYHYDGQVTRIGAEISSASGGVEIFASLKPADHPVKLRPGAFVEISLPDRVFEDHFKIPESSLYNGNQIYVSVDGTLEERSIKVSGFDGENVLVKEGINPGDDVLVTRISEVSAGLRVRREGEAPPRGKRPNGQRPAGKRPPGIRPNGQRPAGNRPPGKRPNGMGNKPQSNDS